MKKKSLTYWKKKAWAECSIFVRTKDMDEKGRAKCFTCGIKKPWKKMYAGHFVQGRRPAILFVTEAIRVQCVGCNRFRHGNLNRFTPKMIKRYGLKLVKEWWRLGETSIEMTTESYEQLYIKFKNLNEITKIVK